MTTQPITKSQVVIREISQKENRETSAASLGAVLREGRYRVVQTAGDNN